MPPKNPGKVRKARSDNFKDSEKMTLINIIANYVAVIDNKITDGKTRGDKDAAWEKVTIEYNHQCKTRETETLRSCWGNLKKAGRKYLANERKATVYTTGKKIIIRVKADTALRAKSDTLFAAQLLQDHKDAVNRQASHLLSTNSAPNHDSMLDESKSMILEVEDDRTAKVYTLQVSPAEYEQARKDNRFARVLLANHKLNLGKTTTSTAANKGSPTTNESIDDPSYDDDFEEIENESTLKRKSSNSSSLWSFNQTQLLLCSYKQYADKLDDGSMTSRAFWTKIKEQLQEKGHSFTLTQCSTKMDTLKRAYKHIKEHNATSGNDRQTCDHYELLDELFHKKPWIKPLSTTGSNLPMSDMNECDEIHQSQRQKIGATMNRAELLRENLEIKRKSEEDKKMYREKKLKLLTDLRDSLKRK